jgi:hypothetical protein
MSYWRKVPKQCWEENVARVVRVSIYSNREGLEGAENASTVEILLNGWMKHMLLTD